MGPCPSVQLVLPQKLWRTVSLPLGVSLNTTPHVKLEPEQLSGLDTPPLKAVPYRFPFWSKTSPAEGPSPSVQLVCAQKLWRTISSPLGVSLNTTPHVLSLVLVHSTLCSPPLTVVPYRFPFWSKISPAMGDAPSVQLVLRQKL